MSKNSINAADVRKFSYNWEIPFELRRYKTKPGYYIFEFRILVGVPKIDKKRTLVLDLYIRYNVFSKS